MMASGEETPAEIEDRSCFICKKNFETDKELAEHLVAHSEEEKYKDGLAKLAERDANNERPTSCPVRKSQPGPSFIRTSFVSPPPPKSFAEPELVDITSDSDEEQKSAQLLQSKTVKLFKIPRPVKSGSAAKFKDAISHRYPVSSRARPRPYLCHICKRYFSTKTVLRQHLYLHVAKPLKQCQFCPKKFTMKSVLRKHEASHGLRKLQERRKKK